MKISKIIVAAGAAMLIAQPALAVDPTNHNTTRSNKASGIIANGGSGDSTGDTVDAKNVPAAKEAAKQVAPASETNADHAKHHKVKAHGKAAPAPAAQPDAATGDTAAPK
ncbi:hypothetical protein D6858_01655 [Tsuneonella suprasediminis]|uniref:Uncharacterized protein n=1 Tax=Tsuneonella suprasediminis TaxID=2306996 RepID=A0A419R5L3_9SPHN|nr:hypothetical protein [Tsuneonella suprasediminis]RJX70864.1 hypothetical protein D6858_01655 [Tsuneonella suprasediminis]